MNNFKARKQLLSVVISQILAVPALAAVIGNINCGDTRAEQCYKYGKDDTEATGLVMSAEKFFTNIQKVKSLVEVQGILIGNTILAKKLELEH